MNGFQNYKLIDNKRNQGTVQNLLSALDVSNGKFVKCISPGDCLYNENTLLLCKRYMEKKHQLVCFGKSIYYSIEDGKFQFYRQHNPGDLSVYRKNNKVKIRRNYFMYSDFPVGASFVAERILLSNYIKKIANQVKYCEDTAYLMMLNDGYEIGFWDDYIVWYEYGTGISTSVNSEWQKIVIEEIKKIYLFMGKKNVQMKKCYNFLYEGLSNSFLENCRKAILSPPYILLGLKKKYSKEKTNYDVENLKRIIQK